MKAILELYRQQLSTSIAAMVQYRGALAIWLIGGILEPLVMLVVWRTVAASGGGVVGGFTASDFAAYYIVMMVANQVTYTWIMWEFDYRVRQGSLSFALLRPVHPIHADIADNLASKTLSLPVVLAAAVGLSAIFRPGFHVQAWSLLATVPALALAFLARFLLEWTLALAAFWTTRVNAINQLYFIVSLFLAGQIAPLELMPGPVRVVAATLPFRWIIAFPTELAMGRLTPRDAVEGLAALAGWALAALVVLRIVWRRGVRLYSAVGA